MAKNRSKKLKKEGKNVAKPNAKIKKVKPNIERKKALDPGPTHADPFEATTSDLTSNKDGGSSRGVEKGKGINKSISGLIFMCNPSTKLECFQYRVFGLPMGKREVVEEIKPGAKLFLFDFELKLLYGVYEATSAGRVNLEPAAFNGKYPAQVKFKIFKECLPLPESSLKRIIKENYNGSKFKQELGGKQVKKLLSSFQPLAAPLSRVISQAPPNVSQLRAMPPPARENQFNQNVGRLPMQVPYLNEARYVHAAQVGPQFRSSHEARYVHAAPVGPTPVQSSHVLQPSYHRPAADVAGVHTTVDRQSLHATGGYYVANSQRPYLTQGIAHEVQEPYLRHRPIEERAPHDLAPNLGRLHKYNQLPSHREPMYNDNAVGYNSYRHASSTKYASNMQVASSTPYTTPPNTQVQHPALGRSQGGLTYYSYGGASR